ncbi:MAG: hypothetical protein KGL43_06310 [Burkholderiales bacterium]|nr:hypothetical protein [Burkholderiales bacterium]
MGGDAELREFLEWLHEVRPDGIYATELAIDEKKSGAMGNVKLQPEGRATQAALPASFSAAEFLRFVEVVRPDMKDWLKRRYATIQSRRVLADLCKPFEELLSPLLMASGPWWTRSTAAAAQTLGAIAQVRASDAPVDAAPTAETGDSDGRASGPATPPARNGEPAPSPLATSDMAYCFAGLWKDEDGWKKPMGTPPKWMQGSIAIAGRRGGPQTHWNPVLLGGVLVRDNYAKQNSVRAKFQTVPMLKPWFDAWKDYEAEYLDTPNDAD